ncbi:MAG: recombinase family protein [Beijerinckiaceae bacterium]|nr:recombinase family protein [Beijerinckiaceae bacterium]
MGVKEIAKVLNCRGFRTRLGARFGTASVHKILTNLVYAGTWLFNQREAKSGRVKAESEVIEVAVPAIIEREVSTRYRRALPPATRGGLAPARRDRTDPPHGSRPLRILRRCNDAAHRNLEDRQGPSLLFLFHRRTDWENWLQGPLHPDGQA